MTVIKIPLETDLEPEFITYMESLPHEFKKGSDGYTYEIKSHNFIDLSWHRLHKKWKNINSEVKKVFDPSNTHCFQIENYTKEELTQYLELKDHLIKTNLCVLEDEITARNLKINVKELLRNSNRSLNPSQYVLYLVLELLPFSHIKVNFELKEFQPVTVVFEKNLIEPKTTELKDSVVLTLPDFLEQILKERFMMPETNTFNIPVFYFSYLTYYQTLINYLECTCGKKTKVTFEAENSSDLNKLVLDFTAIELLDFEYHNLCKIGRKKTPHAQILKNPSTSALAYYYSDILEPLLTHLSDLTAKIPKGYTIDAENVYMWLKKSKKDDLTIKYLKNTIQKVITDSKTLGLKESKNLLSQVKGPNQYAVNCIIDGQKGTLIGHYLQNKDYFLAILKNVNL